ncbi:MULTISPECIES: LPS export ABC transporter periplasmic protein LptC [Vibrio]|uniref:Lipopolysaccharide export system protein LptC n=2 Tax=Vibrio TaxID=662 RepID=A0A7X4LIB8_9VIBR|nr:MULTISPECIES: LPS export ABC transporter periplasmic protein LptC [Vibrio]MBF9001690.1 LPS export ABC transporter periplasmic protein LptC [Vibrio nitrifigilis]MZI92396.1 LPS export ABC transporter periplasmic protein LptC [Vibrio eleionomae]
MSISRIIYVILIFIASWSIYYMMSSESKPDIQVAPNSELPMFTGNQLNNISYNEQGVRSYVIQSTHLEYYAKSGDTIFQSPILKVYQNGTDQEWQVTAKRAVLSKKQVLTLYDDVVAKNLFKDSGFDKMTTKELSIKLDTRDFWADNPVKLTGPQFENNGQAMKGNFADNSALLYKHVQGRYENFTP